MSLSKARTAFEIFVRDFAKSKGLGASYENVQAKHIGEYLECFIVPIEPYLLTFESQMDSAIFQVNFHTSEQKGMQNAEALVSEFMSLFSIGQKVGEAMIYKPVSRSQGMRLNSKLVIAVSIYFQFSNKI